MYRKAYACLTILLSIIMPFGLSITVLSEPASDYTDVKSNTWYSDSVLFCTEHGYMVGLDDHTFGTEKFLTRVQLVQILYALAGKPTVDDKSTFSDVPSGKWYSGACS